MPPSPPDGGESVRFRRNHFSTRLPRGRLYTASHFWMEEDEQSTGVWRVGLTTFATRMLGEIVEFDFEIEPGAGVTTGAVVGWIEGFKATSDLFCACEGEFLGPYSGTIEDPSLICREPFDRGWLYRVRGTPDPDAVDVDGYIQYLNHTIDRMLERPWQSGGEA